MQAMRKGKKRKYFVFRVHDKCVNISYDNSMKEMHQRKIKRLSKPSLVLF